MVKKHSSNRPSVMLSMFSPLLSSKTSLAQISRAKDERMQRGISRFSVLRVMAIGAKRAVQPTIIRVLNVLLPTTLPMAMSALPFRAEDMLTVLPERRDIRIENLSFSYDGADRDYVLNDVNLNIPEHKVTAIVGASGSGKTTLIKLMLGFYTPNKGDIKIGETPLDVVNPHLWRAKSGSVMQDGFIFSDTIANNIAVGEEQVDVERLRHAVTVANIRDFIDSLPLGYNTKIGMEGNGISQGQRQRLLIARAVYKNPEFLFFDEATNALDANNEREIMEHLHTFYRGKTVVVVAHRLSTVRDADKIVVLDRGAVAEEGTHRELTEKKGLYYQLVKNQLELGS